jgi:CheY-like chemotaxis protein
MTKILLVEDDKSLREIYGVRLLAEGYDIVSAGDGEEALAMAIKEKPNLIVSDVMMPKISGFDMLDILRSTTETKEIKVIMMTALSSEDQRLRGEQLGADRYLVKSQVGIEDVVRTVHEVLADAPVAAPTPTFSSSAPRPAPQVAPAARPTTAEPTAPSTPVTAPQPTTASTPAPAPAAPLPQPTAPFSTQRPANLGDRIIHPLERPASTEPDISELISQELGEAPQPFTTVPTPPAPVVPESTPTPATPTTTNFNTPSVGSTSDSSLNFEETPRPSAPPMPPTAPQ